MMRWLRIISTRVYIDNKLDWSRNTDAVFKTATHVRMFYHSVVATVIFYAAVFQGSRVKAADANRLNKLIKKAGSVLGVEPETHHGQSLSPPECPRRRTSEHMQQKTHCPLVED